MSEHSIKKDYFVILFRLGMWWRIIYGVFKLILGVILLKFVHSSFTGLFYKVVGPELVEDPNDVLVNFLGHFISGTSAGVTYFIAIYFIFWGVLDSFLSINLLKLRLWSYPISIVLIGLFTVYEIYRFLHTKSLLLLAIILIDIFILWMINREYGRLRIKEEPK